MQTLIKDQIGSYRKGLGLPGWKIGAVARCMMVTMGVLWTAGLCAQLIEAQVPAVVSSSPVNLTPSGGFNPGPQVVDSCGNVYVNQSGSVVRIAAGTGTQTTVAPNTQGYGGPNAIAIDSTKTNLYFAYGAVWYSSTFGTVTLNSCTPSGITAFGSSASGLFSYYYGTASSIAVDGYGDVFFTPTQGPGPYKIAEIPCATAPATACTAPPTGNPSLALSSWPKTITSLAADSTGNIYFTDSSPAVYELKAPYTAAPVLIGSGAFTDPIGVSFDPAGNLYVSDAVSYPSSPYYATNDTSVVYEIPLESSALNPADKFVVVNNVGFAFPVAVDASQSIYYTSYPPATNLTKQVIGSVSLPATSIGQTSASTPLNYVFNASVTPATIKIDTGTATSTVFANAGGGCTAGTTYTSGQSCTVNLTYKPSAAGLQTGAAILSDSAGAALSTAAVSAIGNGSAVTIDPGTLLPLTGTFKTPKGATTDSQGNVYVADAGNNTIIEFIAGSSIGTVLSTGALKLNGPSGVAVDYIGNIFISDSGNNRILEVPVVNGMLAPAATAALSLSLKNPGGLSFDGIGNLYIADTGNNRLLFVPRINGSLDTSAPDTYGSGFSGPLAVAVDSNRNVYVADTGNNTVEELPGPIGSQAQVKVVTGLNGPTGLATDASGSLYVVDAGNASIYKFPSLSGTLGSKTLVGGSIAAPYGVTIDSVGNLYATDNVNAVVDQIARVQATLPFGSWNVNTTSTPLTASVSNSGNLALTFPSPSFSIAGNTAAGFSVTSDGCASAGTISTGNSCNITATFTPPTTELNAQETLTLLGNETNGTATISLVGTGAHITPSTLTLVLTSPTAGKPLNAGAAVSFSATVGTGSNTAAPGGSVKFFVNGTQVGTSPVTNGVATITLPNGLPGGTVVVSAVYSGDEINYSGSSASITETVIALPDSLTLVALTPYTNPASANDNSANATGPSIPLVATLTPSTSVIPGGTVSFYSGTAANPTLLGLASVMAAGGGTFTATLNEDSLRAGTTNVVENNSTLSNFSVFAVYSGDNSYGPSTSNTTTFAIVAPPLKLPACATATPATCETNTTGATFTITPTNPSITVTSSKLTGQGTGSTVLTINSYGGWTGVLNFTCSGLPAYATCAPYPGGPVATASTPAAPTLPTTVQFFINTNVQPTPPTASGFIWWMSGVFGMMLLITRRRMKRFGFGGVGTALALTLLIIASIVGATGCGSAVAHDMTPAGTSNVTVTLHAAQQVSQTTNESVQLPDSNVGSFTIALTVQ